MSAVPAGERSCHVVLQNVFDGPLDLLLHLVKEQQLDIASVSLSSMADQYFAYISAMEELDVEVAAEYLVMAATLVFLKSRSLLPPIPVEFLPEGEDSPELVEERLRERLLAYSKYRTAGEDLRAFLADAASHYYRDGGDPTSELKQHYRIVADRLKLALLAALRTAKDDKRTIVRDRVTLMEQMTYVLGEIRRDGRVLFSAVCSGLGRNAIVVTFLAILELVRRGRVGFEQSGSFEEIFLFGIAPAEAEATA